MASFEVLLPIGAVAIYVYDSGLLLYGNELVLERYQRGWRISRGLALQLAGRRIYLPNPFSPGSLLFRASWHPTEVQPDNAPPNIPELQRLTRPLRAIVFLQALLLLIGLAPISVVFGAGDLLLTFFGFFYMLSLLAIFVLVTRRRSLGVSGRHCASLAFESLACAPLSVNLVRKLTLSQSPRLSWLNLASESFSIRERLGLAACIDGQIDVLLMDEEHGSAREQRLEAFRSNLKERLGVTIP